MQCVLEYHLLFLSRKTDNRKTTMLRFFPSQVAQLVLSYLKEIECNDSHKKFLFECPYLLDCRQLYEQGEDYMPTFGFDGPNTLLTILQDYGKLKSQRVDKTISEVEVPSTKTTNVTVFKTPEKIDSRSKGSKTPNQRHRVSQSRSQSAVVRSYFNHSPPIRNSPAIDTIQSTPHKASSSSCVNINDQHTSALGKKTDTSNRASSISIDIQKTFLESSSQTEHNLQEKSLRFPICQSSPSRYDHSPNTVPPTPNSDSLGSSPIGPSQSLINNSNPSTPWKGYFGFQTPSKSISDVSLLCDDHSAQKKVADPPEQVAPSVPSSSTTKEKFEPSNLFKTPLKNQLPPPYHRAPDTNSPRLILAHNRSLIPSLSTPESEYRDDLGKSPKRKSVIPRRRLLSDASPLAKQTTNNEPEQSLENDGVFDLADIGEILSYPPVVEKIAESINKVKNTPLKSLSVPQSQSESIDEIIKEVFDTLQQDPLLGTIFNGIGDLSEDSDPADLLLTPGKELYDSLKVEKNASGIHTINEDNQSSIQHINVSLATTAASSETISLNNHVMTVNNRTESSVSSTRLSNTCVEQAPSFNRQCKSSIDSSVEVIDLTQDELVPMGTSSVLPIQVKKEDSSNIELLTSVPSENTTTIPCNQLIPIMQNSDVIPKREISSPVLTCDKSPLKDTNVACLRSISGETAVLSESQIAKMNPSVLTFVTEAVIENDPNLQISSSSTLQQVQQLKTPPPKNSYNDDIRTFHTLSPGQISSVLRVPVVPQESTVPPVQSKRKAVPVQRGIKRVNSAGHVIPLPKRSRNQKKNNIISAPQVLTLVPSDPPVGVSPLQLPAPTVTTVSGLPVIQTNVPIPLIINQISSLVPIAPCIDSLAKKTSNSHVRNLSFSPVKIAPKMVENAVSNNLNTPAVFVDTSKTNVTISEANLKIPEPNVKTPEPNLEKPEINKEILEVNKQPETLQSNVKTLETSQITVEDHVKVPEVNLNTPDTKQLRRNTRIRVAHVRTPSAIAQTSADPKRNGKSSEMCSETLPTSFKMPETDKKSKAVLNSQGTLKVGSKPVIYAIPLKKAPIQNHGTSVRVFTPISRELPKSSRGSSPVTRRRSKRVTQKLSSSSEDSDDDSDFAYTDSSDSEELVSSDSISTANNSRDSLKDKKRKRTHDKNSNVGLHKSSCTNSASGQLSIVSSKETSQRKTGSKSSVDVTKVFGSKIRSGKRSISTLKKAKSSHSRESSVGPPKGTSEKLDSSVASGDRNISNKPSVSSQEGALSQKTDSSATEPSNIAESCDLFVASAEKDATSKEPNDKVTLVGEVSDNKSTSSDGSLLSLSEVASRRKIYSRKCKKKKTVANVTLNSPEYIPSKRVPRSKVKNSICSSEDCNETQKTQPEPLVKTLGKKKRTSSISKENSASYTTLLNSIVYTDSPLVTPRKSNADPPTNVSSTIKEVVGNSNPKKKTVSQRARAKAKKTVNTKSTIPQYQQISANQVKKNKRKCQLPRFVERNEEDSIVEESETNDNSLQNLFSPPSNPTDQVITSTSTIPSNSKNAHDDNSSLQSKPDSQKELDSAVAFIVSENEHHYVASPNKSKSPVREEQAPIGDVAVVSSRNRLADVIALITAKKTQFPNQNDGAPIDKRNILIEAITLLASGCSSTSSTAQHGIVSNEAKPTESSCKEESNDTQQSILSNMSVDKLLDMANSK